MDRYKFRGKKVQMRGSMDTSEAGEFVFGGYVWDGFEHYIITNENIEWSVDPTTLGQITGLKDIEQFEQPKELYTSDIVSMHRFLFDGDEYEDEIIGVLEYDEELACVCLTRIKQDDVKKYMGYDNQEEFEREKIPVCTIIGLHECSWTYLGNIHDSELLEG